MTHLKCKVHWEVKEEGGETEEMCKINSEQLLPVCAEGQWTTWDNFILRDKASSLPQQQCKIDNTEFTATTDILPPPTHTHRLSVHNVRLCYTFYSFSSVSWKNLVIGIFFLVCFWDYINNGCDRSDLWSWTCEINQCHPSNLLLENIIKHNVLLYVFTIL